MSLIFRSIYVSQREFKNTIQRRKERYKSFTQLDKFRCRKTPGITVRTLLQIRIVKQDIYAKNVSKDLNKKNCTIPFKLPRAVNMDQSCL